MRSHVCITHITTHSNARFKFDRSSLALWPFRFDPVFADTDAIALFKHFFFTNEGRPHKLGRQIEKQLLCGDWCGDDAYVSRVRCHSCPPTYKSRYGLVGPYCVSSTVNNRYEHTQPTCMRNALKVKVKLWRRRNNDDRCKWQRSPGWSRREQARAARARTFRAKHLWVWRCNCCQVPIRENMIFSQYLNEEHINEYFSNNIHKQNRIIFQSNVCDQLSQNKLLLKTLKKT